MPESIDLGPIIRQLTSLAADSIAGTGFEGALADHARPLLSRLALNIPDFNTQRGTPLTLNRPDRRLALARRRSGSNVEAVILLERDAGAAAADANRVGTTFDGAPVRKLVIGQAQTLWPEDPTNPRTKLPGNFDNEWRPGRSVAHVKRYAGTLGAFVTYQGRQNPIQGFVGCAHVLAPPDVASRDDDILSPGPPDQPRDPGKFSHGKLASWLALVHYEKQDTPDQVINAADIAVARFDDIANLPDANYVPNPADPDGKLIKLLSVLSEDNILDHSDSGEVYMIGRTSGFRVGTIEAVGASPVVIKLPNGKAYMYRDLIMVQPKDRRLGFSLPGDSGAPVYTAAGGLVGFVVAGTAHYTLVQSGRCLDYVNAQLI